MRIKVQGRRLWTCSRYSTESVMGDAECNSSEWNPCLWLFDVVAHVDQFMPHIRIVFLDSWHTLDVSSEIREFLSSWDERKKLVSLFDLVHVRWYRFVLVCPILRLRNK